MPAHNMTMALFGTLLLWVGWYGFNPGSTLCIVGSCSKLASKVAVVTTISAASSVLTLLVFTIATKKPYDLALMANGLLAGLVGVTASCAVIEPWGAFICGIGSALVFYGSKELLKFIEIDDPVDAAPIHGFCGFWGALAVGIFGADANAKFAGYAGSAAGFHPIGDGEQFAVQLIGALAIAGWTVVTSTALFVTIKYTIGLRVSDNVEAEGLDLSEHGGKAYNNDGFSESFALAEKEKGDEEDVFG